MRSSLRRLANSARTPVPLAPAGYGPGKGMRFPLTGGVANMATFLATYKRSGTVYAIVSLLAEKAASTNWRLYKKQPVDGRRRYTTSDVGSDQRTEVISHPALKLWTKPNDFFTRFEFNEGSNQHFGLTGETFWVVDRQNLLGMPTSMWYVRPDRMTPVPDQESYLLGWIYTAPSGEQIPLRINEVIQEKRADPEDSYRGSGPIASILPNIEQQRYATEYQRNLFINGASPGGTLTVPNSLTDPEFEELIARWRETHQGVARAGAVGVLENGITWAPDGVTNKDMDYANLRLNNRDEIREAFRIHKAMLGVVEDVNRANAETGQEVFDETLIIPLLDRRKETLNAKLLAMFGDSSVEFDFDSPLVPSREEENAELATKASAWATLVGAGADPHDAAEVVGLPDMKMVETATQVPALPPGWVAAPPPGQPDQTATDQTATDQALAMLLQRQLRPFTTRALPAAIQNRRR